MEGEEEVNAVFMDLGEDQEVLQRCLGCCGRERARVWTWGRRGLGGGIGMEEVVVLGVLNGGIGNWGRLGEVGGGFGGWKVPLPHPGIPHPCPSPFAAKVVEQVGT